MEPSSRALAHRLRLCITSPSLALCRLIAGPDENTGHETWLELCFCPSTSPPFIFPDPAATAAKKALGAAASVATGAGNRASELPFPLCSLAFAVPAQCPHSSIFYWESEAGTEAGMERRISIGLVEPSTGSTYRWEGLWHPRCRSVRALDA